MTDDRTTDHIVEWLLRTFKRVVHRHKRETIIYRALHDTTSRTWHNYKEGITVHASFVLARYRRANKRLTRLRDRRCKLVQMYGGLYLSIDSFGKLNLECEDLLADFHRLLDKCDVVN